MNWRGTENELEASWRQTSNDPKMNPKRTESELCAHLLTTFCDKTRGAGASLSVILLGERRSTTSDEGDRESNLDFGVRWCAGAKGTTSARCQKKDAWEAAAAVEDRSVCRSKARSAYDVQHERSASGLPTLFARESGV